MKQYGFELFIEEDALHFLYAQSVVLATLCEEINTVGVEEHLVVDDGLVLVFDCRWLVWDEEFFEEIDWFDDEAHEIVFEDGGEDEVFIDGDWFGWFFECFIHGFEDLQILDYGGHGNCVFSGVSGLDLRGVRFGWVGFIFFVSNNGEEFTALCEVFA